MDIFVVWLVGGYGDSNLCTRTRKAAARSVNGKAKCCSDGQRNMPFYQVLCIAAHNPEYVRDETRPLGPAPCLISLGLHSDKSKASSASRPRTYSTAAASFAESSTGAPRRFLSACGHMESTMNTESAFCPSLLEVYLI